MPAFSLGSLSSFAVTTTGTQTIQASKTFLSPATGSVPLSVQGMVSQTANLTEWRNGAGSIVTSVNTSGDLIVGAQVASQGHMHVTALAPGNKVLIVRGAASQTGNITEWQDSAGTTLARINPAGAIVTENRLYAGATAASTLPAVASVNVVPMTTASPGVVVRGLASQTANLQEWQGNNGVLSGLVTSTGEARFRYLKGAAIGATIPGRGMFEVVSEAATVPPIIARAAASHTATLLELQNSAGTILAGFNASGDIMGPAWTPYTPALVGVTNIGIAAKYKVIGRTCIIAWQLTALQGGSYTGTVGFSLPFAPNFTTVGQYWNSFKIYHPAAGGEFSGGQTTIYNGGGSTVYFRTPQSTSTQLIVAWANASPYGVAFNATSADAFGTIIYEI